MQTNKKKLGKVLAFRPFLIFILWFIVSFIFFAVKLKSGGVLSDEWMYWKSIGNSILGIFILMSIVLVPLGIYLWRHGDDEKSRK